MTARRRAAPGRRRAIGFIGALASALVGALVAATMVTPGSMTGLAAARSVGPTWKDIEKTLSDEIDPSSPNPCNRGDELCLGIVLGEMTRRMGLLARKCSHHAPFGATYAIVGQRIVDGWPFTFRDPAYLAHLDAVFASVYFDAYDAWKRGARDVAPAWQLAFDAAKTKSVSGLGDMLLGVNAHISNDLPFVLERVGLAATDGSDAYDDFARANQVIADVQNLSIDTVARDFDPSVADVTIPGLFVGREGFIALIGTWRAEAWGRAQQLLAATTPATRRAIAGEIQAVANSRALLIRTATSYVPPLSSTRARDEYCRAQHT